MKFRHAHTTLLPQQDVQRAAKRHARLDASGAIFAAARVSLEAGRPRAVIPTSNGWKVVDPDVAVEGTSGYYLADGCEVKSFVPTLGGEDHGA
jgi:hypothetical protein